MFVEITEIEQSFSLKDRQVANYLVLDLGNGKLLKVPVDEEAMQFIIEASVNGKEVEPQVHTSGYMAPVSPPSSSSIEPLGEAFTQSKIKWMELPETQLSPFMKKILLQTGTPMELSQLDLDSLISKIIDKMSQAKAETQPPSLQFVDGPVVMRRPPMRTVPKDDDGYPIVGTTQGIDPGEVVERSRDMDEDGVGQL